jgi:sulfite exporter TauE/SafE
MGDAPRPQGSPSAGGCVVVALGLPALLVLFLFSSCASTIDALYAAIGLTVAAVVVFLAFLFEIARWRVSRKEERVARMTLRPTAGTRAA